MLTLHQNPTLYELLAVCADAPQDVQDQWTALTGEVYVTADVAVALYSVTGPKFVLMEGSKPIACGGFIYQRPGVYRDWLVALPEAFGPRYWRSVTKFCRRVMDGMLDEQAHRLECVALHGRDQRILDWYRVLGYKFEGTQVAAGANGEDLLAYYRVRNH